VFHFAETRLLPNLAKHVVLTMLYSPDPVSIVDFDTWFASDPISKQCNLLHTELTTGDKQRPFIDLLRCTSSDNIMKC